MSRLRKEVIAEMLATMPNPDSTDTTQRCVIQLQRKVSVQDKLIHDLSGAVTRLQQQLYVIKQTQKG